jgi:hypothetical protein
LVPRRSSPLVPTAVALPAWNTGRYVSRTMRL